MIRSRRRFLETLSALPLAGGLAAASAAPAAAASTRRRGVDYFRELGVRPFINAAGTYTAMTASLMPPEVMEAIQYASKHYVMLDELHDKVGERIATLVRAEAAMVTSGAASALTLGTAAVLTGSDRQKIVDLPNLAGMKSEVIIQKAHRFGYDHAVRNCGVRLVEVETPEELERAVTEKTAMMLFYNNNNGRDRSRTRSSSGSARSTGSPPSTTRPPTCRRSRTSGSTPRMGFDLVAFSGGKGIRGPQSAGLLLGRKALIEAARLNAPPNGNTVGRGMKVNKEEMLGMLVALELFLEKDHARERREFERRAELVRASATAVPGVKAEVFVPEVANHVPHVRISWDGADEKAATAVVKAMRDGEPSIGIRSEGRTLVIGVWMMQPGEDKVVARRLRQVLEKKA